jgi:hypothetical protein
MFKRFFFFVFSLCLTGCVTHIPLNEQVPVIEYKNNDRLIVSVVDDRQRIKDGKARDFIGVAHAAFGIPVDWHVKHVLAVEEGDKERDLSQWLQYRVVKGLENKGWNVIGLELESVPDKVQAKSILEDNNSVKFLLMQIKEWYFSINLNWVSAFNFDTDTNVIIYEINNGEILSKNFSGRDVIDEKASESPQNNILRAYRDQLVEILSDQEVKNSLVGENTENKTN